MELPVVSGMESLTLSGKVEQCRATGGVAAAHASARCRGAQLQSGSLPAPGWKARLERSNSPRDRFSLHLRIEGFKPASE